MCMAVYMYVYMQSVLNFHAASAKNKILISMLGPAHAHTHTRIQT